MFNVANTLPKHFRRFESSEYRKSLPELIEHDRYLPLTEPQAKRHADLQNQLFHLRLRASGFRLQEKAADANPEVKRPEPETSPKAQCPKPGALLLHETQAIIAEMLNTANDMACCCPEIGNLPVIDNPASGYKIDTMYELLQEHLESPQVKAVVFAHDIKLLHLAGSKLAKSPVEYDVIDRYMPPRTQKNVNIRFQRAPNCRVLFVSDGVDTRLVFKNVQLVIHLDFPWDTDCIRQRLARIIPHPAIQPCHAYQLISYGTIEHLLAKLRGNDQLLVASDLRDGLSVVLLDEPDRVKFFEHVAAMLPQVKESPMVIPSLR
jgi:SNF2 family DNA or RNA helicase